VKYYSHTQKSIQKIFRRGSFGCVFDDTLASVHDQNNSWTICKAFERERATIREGDELLNFAFGDSRIEKERRERRPQLLKSLLSIAFPPLSFFYWVFGGANPITADFAAKETRSFDVLSLFSPFCLFLLFCAGY